MDSDSRREASGLEEGEEEEERKQKAAERKKEKRKSVVESWCVLLKALVSVDLIYL